MTSTLPSSDVITSLTILAFNTTESTIAGAAGLLDVDHVDDPRPQRAEVGDFAVRMDPDFRCLVRIAHDGFNNRRGTSYVARRGNDCGGRDAW